VYVRPLTVTLCLAAILGAALAGPAHAAGAEVLSPTALADLLEDDEARATLIDALRREVAPQEAPLPPGPEGVAARVASTTQSMAQGLVTELSESAAAVVALFRGELWPAEPEVMAEMALHLGLVMLLSITLFFSLRRAIRGLFARLSRWVEAPAQGRRLARRALAAGLAATVDVVIIALAWVAGYALALLALGEHGEMTTGESLFLNAFLAVEVFKVTLRTLFASRHDGLRLVPLDGEEAAYWNAWLARLVGFIGYGLLFLVPLVSATLAPALGRMLSVLLMAVAFIYALVIILQNRERVARGIKHRAQGVEMAFSRVLLGLLARIWHGLAIAYFAALGLVTLLQPDQILPYMLRATLQSLASVGAGVFLALILSSVISRRLRLPAETCRRFPTLEGRLNSYIPSALKVMRVAILVVVGLVVIDAWRLFDLSAWLGSEAGAALLGTMFSVALILLAASALWTGLASWIEARLGDLQSNDGAARAKTLLSIFRSAAAVVISILTIMVVLSELGINIGPLIAGAGVVGLAVGFGAQKLVQDIITGIFIQLENAIHVGDVVTVAATRGTVEKLTIRSLGVRDLAGAYHLVPFSSVDMVTNFNRDYGYHLAEYGVAYREDVDDVMHHLRAAFEELKADPEQASNILADIEIPGVTSFGDSAVTIRVRIKAVPGTQWALGRAYNRLVKRHFDAAGIEIPFPHTTLYFGQDKDGTAAPARVRLETADGPAGAPSAGSEHLARVS